MRTFLIYLQWVMYRLANIIVIITGIPIVAIGLLFRSCRYIQWAPFTEYIEIEPGWNLCMMPNWMFWWNNFFDGCYGDKRGWWANNQKEKGRDYKSWLSCFLWTAIRNPANGFSRLHCGVDTANLDIVLESGSPIVEADIGFPGYQYLIGYYRGTSKISCFRIFIEWPYPNCNHGLLVDLGWKIKLSHNDVTEESPLKDRMKGTVMTISPWKSFEQNP